MAKLPYMKFYPDHWVRDMSGHPLEIQGAWIRLCCELWWSETRGKLTRPIEYFERILGGEKEKTLEVFRYLDRYKISNITFANDEITVICRRMAKEDKTRIGNKLRQRRHQESKKKRKNNTEITPHITEDIYKTPISPLTKTQKKQPVTQAICQRIVDACNQALGTRNKLTPTMEEKIRGIIKFQGSDWVNRYEQASKQFPTIDDSGWSSGKVSLAWSLRDKGGRIDEILNGGYKRKINTTKPIGKTYAEQQAEARKNSKPVSPEIINKTLNETLNRLRK